MGKQHNLQKKRGLLQVADSFISDKKRIALSVFLFATVVIGGVTFLMPEVYRATVSVRVLSIKDLSRFCVDEMCLDPKAALEMLANKLDLKNKSGKQLTQKDKSQKLNIKESANANILQLQVIDASPKKVLEIAYAWAKIYQGYQGKQLKESLRKSMPKKLETARQNFTQSKELVEEFQLESGLDLMSAKMKNDTKNMKENEKSCGFFGFKFTRKISRLERDVKRKEARLAKLNQKMKKNKMAYEILTQKHEEALAVKAAELDEVEIISSSMEMIGHNRGHRILVAGVIAVFFYIFLGFLMGFFQRDTGEGKILR
ncbi:MAG: hypothetical protein GY858_03050 [Candidatus Omnitrophica bacterium]|nr:hypothetical protein [Candidatus Omnitrophota bacterium]